MMNATNAPMTVLGLARSIRAAACYWSPYYRRIAVKTAASPSSYALAVTMLHRAGQS